MLVTNAILISFELSNSAKQQFETLLLFFEGAIYRKYKESSANKRNLGGCVISILANQNKSNGDDLSEYEKNKLELINLYHQNCYCHNEDVCKMACNLDPECKGFARFPFDHTCKLATTSRCPKGCNKSTSPYPQGSQLECYIKEVRQVIIS